MRTLRTPSMTTLMIVAFVGLLMNSGSVLAQGDSPVPVFKNGNASDTPKLVFAERGGVPNRFIALLHGGTRPVPAEAADLVERFGGSVRRAWDSALRGFLVEMSEAQARRMSRNPLIKGIYQDIELPADEVLANDAPYCYPEERNGCEPPGNWIFNQRTFQGLPQEITCNDPDPSGTGCIDNWGLDRLDGISSLDGLFQPTGAPQGTGVHVYVLDTGIKAENLDFTGRVSGGHNGTYDEPQCDYPACLPLCFPPCGDDTTDYHGHGTHVAAILGGQFFGVAKDVTLHPVRFYNRSCLYEESALIDGIEWIVDTHNPAQGTGIVNLSSADPTWATAPGTQPLREAIQSLASRDDLLLVQAAGNGDTDACAWGFGDENL